MSLRRFRVLVQHLPRSSALFRAMHPEEVDWGLAEQLLGLVAELIDYGNRNFIAAYSEANAQIPEPLDIRRPGKPKPEPPKGLGGLIELSKRMGGYRASPRHLQPLPADSGEPSRDGSGG